VRIRTFSGTVGWVIRSGVSIRHGGGTQNPSVGSTVPRHHVASSVRRAAWSRGKTIYVYGLRVHSGPSVSAAVIATLSRGNRVGVFGRYGAWDKILLASGTVGWAMARYVGRHVASGNRGSAGRAHARGHTVLRAGVNIRSRPSMQASIVAVSNGSPVRVLHWAPGWADVQLSTGASGWVWRAFLGGYHAHRAVRSGAGTGSSGTNSSSGAHVTAGVRVHARPGYRSAVITVLAQGTHVVILRSISGWDYVRLPGGGRGWVAAAYVAG
jgi:SH3-like domain-containing protein